MSDALRSRIVELYQDGDTMEQVGRAVGVSAERVSNELRRAGVLEPGIPAPPRTRRWNVEPGVFTRKTDHDVAYFAGLLVADGSVRARAGTVMPRLVLSLEESDTYLVRAFAALVGLDEGAVRVEEHRTPNGYVTRHARINSFHEDWPAALEEWGVVPRKSWVWREPRVALEVLPAFLRGWFDGDGSLSKSQPLWRLSGTKDGVLWYENALRALGYQGGAHHAKVPASPTSSTLVIGGRWQVQQVRSIISGPGPRMARKWDDFRPTRRTQTASEVGAHIGLSTSTVMQLCDDGAIPFDWIAGARRIDPEEALHALGWSSTDLARTARASDVARALGLSEEQSRILAKSGVFPSRSLQRAERVTRQFNVDECRVAYAEYKARKRRRRNPESDAD